MYIFSPACLWVIVDIAHHNFTCRTNCDIYIGCYLTTTMSHAPCRMSGDAHYNTQGSHSWNAMRSVRKKTGRRMLLTGHQRQIFCHNELDTVSPDNIQQMHLPLNHCHITQYSELIFFVVSL